MAEKGFGVKEVNLIGASGTPTITSPNNLNLNANNVAISTNVSIGGTLTVSGNISVGGTLTYEDVTNIDSVGLVTARNGVFIPDTKELKIGNTAGSPDLKLYHDASDSHIANTTGVFFIQNTGDLRIRVDNTDAAIHCVRNGAVELHHAGTKKLETSSSGATVTGTLSATTFSGSGASLTNLPVADSDIQVAYTVTANGSSAYRFAGNGVVSTADNPDLYLIRGQKYRFVNNSGGSHPFQIREASGGTAYSTGVTNNGAASGNIDFAPTYDSPAQLVYQCTSHGGMVGNIYLRDAAGGNTNVGVTTFSGGITASGNASFAGNNVTMTASGSPNSLNVSGTSRFEIASIENAEIDGDIAHSGDTDTKISFDTNTIKFDTAGSERLRINSNGDMGLGLTASYSGLFGGSQRTFQIGGTAAPCLRITSSTSNQADLVIHAGNSGRRADIANITENGSISMWTKPTGGSITERLQISADGYVTKPYNLCLQYTKSSSNVTTGTVIYDTEVFDVGNSDAYDTSTGQFTAPVTGIYRIQFEHFASGTGRATANIEKSTNGGSSWSVIKIGMRVYASSSSGSNWPSVPTIYYAQLNANDKIRITHREGTIHLNTPWNHLTIQLVQ